MNSTLMIYGIILVLSTFIVSASDATSWKQTGVEIIRSNPTELVITYKPKILGYDTSFRDGQRIITPRIKDVAIGEYTLNIPIAVPSPSGFTLSSVTVVYTNATKKNHEPIQSQPWATLRYAGIARDKHLSHLFITTAQYDAVAGNYHIPASITAVIRFTEKPESLHSAPKDSPVFVLNHEQSAFWGVKPLVRTFSPLQKPAHTVQSSPRKILKVHIDAEGIYRITAQDLSDMGITIQPTDIPFVKLIGTGGLPLSETMKDADFLALPEQPILVRTGANGQLNDIIFYGGSAAGFMPDGKGDFEHFVHPYTNQSSYVLTVGGLTPGKRMDIAPSVTEPIINKPTTYSARIFNEEELVNPFGIGSGREWFGKQVDASLPATYTSVLDGLVRQGNIRYRYVVAHKNATSGTFTVTESGKNLGTTSVGGVGSGSYNYVDAIRSPRRTAQLSAASLGADNRSALQFSYANSTPNSTIGFIDWFEIAYPAELTARNNTLELFTDTSHIGSTEYTINGFSGEVWGMDVTNRQNPILMTNMANTGGMFIVRTNLEPKSPRRFLLSGNIRKPRMSVEQSSPLFDADYSGNIIVIAHPDVIASANEYKKYRESQGEYTVSVISTADIYNEFSGGMLDVSALRNFIGKAYHTWKIKPEYILLWGDGHFDPKNISFQTANLVPAYQIPQIGDIFHSVDSYCTEDYYVRVVGSDRIPDIAIGRIPVINNNSGYGMIDKIRLYENDAESGIWRTISTFVADDGPTTVGNSDGNTHTEDAELVAQGFPNFIQPKKIYMVEYPLENAARGRRKPSVTEQFISTANSTGTLTLNWVGHGSPRLWANEMVFEKDVHIPMFTNTTKPFFLSGATCDFGRFDDANRQCGAEDFVTKRTGGAIAVFASTRAVYANQNSQITNRYFTELFSTNSSKDKYLTIGQALYNTKLSFTSENDQKFLILGDPALRLNIPSYRIVIDTINNSPLKETDAVALKALSKVTIRGSVYDLSGKFSDDFTGNVFITMRDGSYVEKLKDPTDPLKPNEVHVINKVGGILNRSSWKVENGIFSAEFIIPKDISFTNANGGIYLYANSGKKHAAGKTDKVIINGVDTVEYDDSDGPSMDLFIDSRQFSAGDMVRNAPMLILDLSDETGINTTGAGIGHNIEFRIDDGEPIDATDTYQTSFTDSKKGSAQKQVFNLVPGHHTVTARAWDVLNNYRQTTTHFVVADPNSFIAQDVLTYPNPSSGETRMNFIHNQSQPFSVEIHIFAADGSLVRTFSTSVNQVRNAEIAWDAKDNNGNMVPSGPYYFFIEGTAFDGKRMTVTGSHTIVRQ